MRAVRIRKMAAAAVALRRECAEMECWEDTDRWENKRTENNL